VDVVKIASNHHEFADGSGYPNQLRGRQLCAFTRDLTVADIVEALIADRVYKKAMTVAEALALMEEVYLRPGKIDVHSFARLNHQTRNLHPIASVTSIPVLSQWVTSVLEARSIPYEDMAGFPHRVPYDLFAGTSEVRPMWWHTLNQVA